MPDFGPLAIDGGEPVRRQLLPYARQTVDDDDITAVVEALRSDWLTTGPLVETFEKAFASEVGAGHAVAVSSGTAALHAAVAALGIGAGDEVIIPALTFVATANCVVFQGGKPVFADVDPETLLLDPNQVEALVTPRTRAVIAVDYAGQPCYYDGLREITDAHEINLVADA
jgi:perosamine synthetase